MYACDFSSSDDIVLLPMEGLASSSSMIRLSIREVLPRDSRAYNSRILSVDTVCKSLSPPDKGRGFVFFFRDKSFLAPTLSQNVSFARFESVGERSESELSLACR